MKSRITIDLRLIDWLLPTHLSPVDTTILHNVQSSIINIDIYDQYGTVHDYTICLKCIKRPENALKIEKH